MNNGNSELLKDLGIFGLKTLITLNSGSVVVLLAFIGRDSGAANFVDIDIGNIKLAMISFLFGISLALISLFITYLLAQLQNLGRHPRPWIFLTLMLLPAAISFVSFIVGFSFAVESLS